MRKVRWLLLLTAVVVLLAPSPAHAYIGPGAGFAAPRLELRDMRARLECRSMAVCLAVAVLLPPAMAKASQGAEGIPHFSHVVVLVLENEVPLP